MRLLLLALGALFCLSLGVFSASMLARVMQKPGPPDFDDCKKALRTNLIMGWVFFALSIFTFLPLNFDPIPLKGTSTIIGGFILLGVSGFFLMYRQFRLQVLAVMALVREHGSKLTKTQIIENLGVGEERANALIKYLRRNNIVMVTSEEGSIEKELSEEAKERMIDRLHDKLRKIPRELEWKLLREIRALRNTFREKGAWASGINDYSVSEILSGVEELFNNCVYSLERAYELWSAADAIQTETTKQATQRQRDELISDVQKSVEQLGKNLIDIQDSRKESKGEEADTKLARLRDEIKQRIEIARKVRERMENLEGIYNIDFGKE